jgi:hypothetical protein
VNLGTYDIITVDPLADREHEQMGSKAKFWYRTNDGKWLFKRCRPGTGEDWAEKVAAEVAGLLGLPHALVELAEVDGTKGSICLDFAGHSDLIHGNELLWQLDQSYPLKQFWRVSAHTVENVLRVLINPALAPPPESVELGMTAAQIFTGYLALDALIGNGDRHHENWALLRSGGQIALAPTYDHASSLGRELTDERRRALLGRPDGVASYARKGRSALYAELSAKRPLSTHAAFQAAAAQVPGAQEAWIARISGLSEDALQQIMQRVPSQRISALASEFALQLMRENQQALCAAAQAS